MTIRVLSVASEVFPLVKTGGLADVVGALPAALTAHDVAVTTLVPGYPAVLKQLGKGKLAHAYPDLMGVKARLTHHEHDGLRLMVLEAPALFDRPGGPYGDPATGHDWPDNWQRFAALSRAAADMAGGLGGLDPDVVHAHDWQAALTPAYMRHGAARAAATPSVMTIHNMAFQGRYGAEIFPRLGLPADAFSLHGVEYYGGVGFLKAGMQMASRVTTVSPTYAREIRDPSFGMGLEGLVAARGSEVRGIVNGIDTDIWNPETDPGLASGFTAATLRKRQANKRAVELAFGLTRDDGPLFCAVSRLTWQKGMDVLCEVIDTLVGMGARLALLGAGDAALEAALMGAAHRHPGRVGVRIGYDETLSHLMQGGSDAILIPSRFEPCGLTQLYGLHYGCVPVVARTGGLADTVIDANEAALSDGVATGFQFDAVTADGLIAALGRTVDVYHRPEQWRTLQKRGMKTDVSWGRSGRRYAELYAEILTRTD